MVVTGHCRTSGVKLPFKTGLRLALHTLHWVGFLCFARQLWVPQNETGNTVEWHSVDSLTCGCALWAPRISFSGNLSSTENPDWQALRHGNPTNHIWHHVEATWIDSEFDRIPEFHAFSNICRGPVDLKKSSQ